VLLAGKAALVTGAASGIGRAIARRYAAEGARLALLDVAVEAGEAAAAEIVANGGEAVFLRCDTGDRAAVDQAVADAEAALGPSDIAVCAAGVTGKYGTFDVLELEDLEAVLRINLFGPYLVGRAVAKRMLAGARGGSIINISSVGAVLAAPELFAYSVSKAGLNMLTKTMALTLAERGIRVNAIAPGPVDSPLLDHLDASAREVMLSRTPLGRFGTPEEIAGIALFLAGPDAGYIVGQTLYAEGGRLALNYLTKTRG
jgi:NAD(P)-dependent dehydrogenase (short-subunit alcohol dehydrogenase family)